MCCCCTADRPEYRRPEDPGISLDAPLAVDKETSFCCVLETIKNKAVEIFDSITSCNPTQSGFFGSACDPFHNLLGIVSEFYVLFTDNVSKEKLYAVLNIFLGIGGLGRLVSTAAMAATCFWSVAQMVGEWAVPLSFASSLLSCLCLFSYAFKCYHTHEALETFKAKKAENPEAAIKFLIEETSDRELSRHLNCDGHEMKERLRRILNKCTFPAHAEQEPAVLKRQLAELAERIEIRLEDRQKSDALGCIIAIISAVVAVVFFFTFATPLAPVGIILAGISLFVQGGKCAFDIWSSCKFNNFLDTLDPNPITREVVPART